MEGLVVGSTDGSEEGKDVVSDVGDRDGSVEGSVEGLSEGSVVDGETLGFRDEGFLVRHTVGAIVGWSESMDRTIDGTILSG